ncbi:cadherin repeat domain-containing protein [Leptolyngbya sp. 7M]|uniref:cadherin repeat domain-containing protein n=1 Tax=Leptolyngbya sp. 7M TaxID=2812896 RepID=UPI001B8D4B45|nr:cadherin repeat domain-containing protein [Leptolyngbya sp. 7M]QYO63946.1 cadherin repeat domain-containing protein [Leptolyngbya sp. 7M]
MVGTFASVDPDGDTSFSYELVAGTGSADNNAFTIAGNELRIKNSPDFETKSSYSIRVKTTDPGGLSFEKPLTITIRNLNEAPTGISIDSNTVNENVPVNTLVGRLSTTDPDANNTFSYRLVSGVGSTDNALFEISGNELRIKTVPNFEVKPTYSVRIQSSDQNGLTVQRQFTINVRDLNEAPTNISISKNNINENVPANSVVGSFSTTDPDANDSFTYELVTGQGSADNNAFVIVGNELRIKNSPDFETKPSYSIRVRSRDKGGLATEKIFTININDLNDPPTNAAPTNLNLTPANVNENVDPNTLVGTLSTVDPNPGNTFTYALVAGAGDTDNNTFTISGNQLRIKISPNFEQKSTYSIRVRTTDQGGLNFERSLTININDLNEAPTDILLNPDTVDENVPAGSLVGNLTSLDSPYLPLKSSTG